MRTSLWVALVSAVAMVPAVAQAQDAGDRQGWRNRGQDQAEQAQQPGSDGRHDGRGDRGRAQTPQYQAQSARPQAQPARPQAQPVRPQAQPVQPQAQPVRPQARVEAQAGGYHRDEGRDAGPPSGYQGSARDYRAHHRTSPADVQDARSRPDAGYRGRPDATRNGQWNGGRWNGDHGPDGYRNGQWNRGGHAYGGNYRNDGGWNRDWRRDGRYNWNGYRSANRYAFRLPHYYAPRGWGYGYRRFDIGVRLYEPLFAQNYWIDSPWEYRLPEAYGPYRWVRYYDDALLIDLESGQVVDAVYGIFD